MKNKEISITKLLHTIQSISRTQVALKENLSLNDLLALKVAISPVNNLITEALTKKFIAFLPTIMSSIDEATSRTMLRDFEGTNVNANGFDFYNSDHNIVAEVKANIPYEGEKYGSAQISGLNKDIYGLLHGKKKGEIDPENYYKFLVLLSYENRDEGYSTDKAIQHFIKKKTSVEVWRPEITLSKDKVYIISLKVQ